MEPMPVLGVVTAGSSRPREMAMLISSLVLIGHRGPVIVVDGSGTAAIWNVAQEVPGFDELDARAILVDPKRLGRFRHNVGARAAIEAGATHLLFPNDYQTVLSLPTLCGTDDVLPPAPSIGIGKLQARERSDALLVPPIYKESAVTAKSSWRARRRAWGSALEALMLISEDMFSVHGGWSEHIIPGDPSSIAYAGDGLELVARCMEAGGTVYPMPSLILGGGHRGPGQDASLTKFKDYGRGTIQLGRHLGFAEWYLALQVTRAQCKALGIGLRDTPSISGSREEWQQRAAGMRSEWFGMGRRR